MIIAETLHQGDKLLVFSQSLSTLDLLEHFLSKIQIPRKPDEPEQLPNETWCRNKNYFRKLYFCIVFLIFQNFFLLISWNLI